MTDQPHKNPFKDALEAFDALKNENDELRAEVSEGNTALELTVEKLEETERERDVIKGKLAAAEAKVAAVIAALGIGDTSGLAIMSEYPAEAPAEAPAERAPRRRRVVREPGAPDIAEPIGGLADEIERLNETFPDEPQTPGMAEFMAKAHQEAFGTPAPSEANPDTARVLEVLGRSNTARSESVLMKLAGIPTAKRLRAALREPIAQGIAYKRNDGMAGFSYVLLDQHRVNEPTPAPAPSADLSDMMAAIERVTGQKANFTKAPAEQPKAVKLGEDSEYLRLSREYLIKNGISPELAIRREAISALDSDSPVPISIEELIGNAREYGLKTEEQAYAVLDQLVIDYPGLILRDGNRYRSLVTIAPRDENGETPPHIGVVGTDWDAMAAEECEALKPLHHGMDANDTAIMRALKQWANQSDDFLSVHYLWLNARAHGYTNGEPTLRYRMKLAPKPLAKTHAHLIEEQAKPLGWRLRQPSPDGGDKVKADDEAPASRKVPDSLFLDALSTTEERGAHALYHELMAPANMSDTSVNRRLRELVEKGLATRRKGAQGEYFYRKASA